MQELLNPAGLFIQDYLELHSMIESDKKWLPEKFLDNPPRYYRILRAQSCLRALGNKTEDIQDFMSNDAIPATPKSVVDIIEKKLKSSFDLDYESYIRNKNSFNPLFIFRSLLHIRTITYRFAAYKSTILAASNHYLTPYLVADKLQEKLSEEIEVIDEVLRLILNPYAKKLTLDELIDCFEYPNVDLDEIDLEWI